MHPKTYGLRPWLWLLVFLRISILSFIFKRKTFTVNRETFFSTFTSVFEAIEVGTSLHFRVSEKIFLWLERLKPCSHIPPTHLRRGRRLQLTTLSWRSVSVAPRSTSAMDRRHTRNCANTNRIGALEHFARADHVRIKYFHRGQPQACLHQFNFAGKPAINVWDRHKDVWGLPVTD